MAYGMCTGKASHLQYMSRALAWSHPEPHNSTLGTSPKGISSIAVCVGKKLEAEMSEKLGVVK